MIWQSPLVVDVDRRDQQRAFRKRTFRFIVLVVVGTLLSGWLYSPAPTPTTIARSYLEAGFARDWEDAWGQLCRRAKASQEDYAQYAERSAAEFGTRLMPTDVRVAVTGIRGVPGRGDGPAVAVAVSVTSFDRRPGWRAGGEYVLVEEDGTFRICGGGMGGE
jgi:hypothetical protein